jgi:hypothetical protein
MQSKIKLQWAAGAVIANGLLAMTAMAPRPALANPCSPYLRCGSCFPLSYCQSIAPPGCTATSTTCTPDACPPNLVLGRCYYN